MNEKKIIFKHKEWKCGSKSVEIYMEHKMMWNYIYYSDSNDD